MREIKFRAKRIDADKFPTEYQWVYGQYFKTPLTDENSGATPDAGWFFLSGEPRHCIVQDGVSFVIDVDTLGQYTGFKDKNNQEIYEGDILKVIDTDNGYYDDNKNWISDAEYQTVVKYDNGAFYIEVGDIADYDITAIGWALDFEIEIEIIGNIYENVDLINK